MTGKDRYYLLLEIPRGESGCPLTLEDCIKHILLKVFYTPVYRNEVLDLLYCHQDIGIRWGKDGRLIDTVENNYLTPPTYQSMKEFDGDLERINFCAKNNQSGWSPFRWYPLITSVDHNLLSPQDAQEDFLQGAIEVCDTILGREYPPRQEGSPLQARNDKNEAITRFFTEKIRMRLIGR